MKERRNAHYNLIYAVLGIAAVLIVIITAMGSIEDDVTLIKNAAQTYNVKWEYMDKMTGEYEPCTLPLSLDRTEYMELRIRKQLGTEAKDGNYIMYRSNHATNRVYIDDRIVYSYATKENSAFKLPGSAWIIVPLKDSYKGKYINIHLQTILSKYGGVMEEVLIGDRGDMIEYLLMDNAIGIIMCFIILFVSFILFCMWIVEKRTFSANRLLYLSLFSLLIFIWSVNETHCTQLVFGNMRMITVLTYETLALCPMPLILFYCCSKHRLVRDISSRLAILPIVDFCVINILHFLGMVDMSDLLILTHITMVIVGVSLCYAHIRSGMFGSRKVESELSEIGAIGFFVLALAVFIDIFNYYTRSFVDGSRYSRIGLLVYILMLTFDTLHLSLSDQINVKKAEIYKTLAFTDNLTGLGNRQAFDQEIKRINEREELLEKLVVGILNLNNLKVTNDSLGHAEGDRYIISSSDIVQLYFGKIARIFRIGGDEFAVVFTGQDSDVYFETEANMFDDIMNGIRQDVNFAYGSAVYNHITDKNAEDTIKRADEKMCASKKKYKHSVGAEK
ncbi:MAG: GGDEF domain-containing protein [Lachnospiraceae bacterium]|nr:GGDEF domain-containing protein [Lachnospiraceae bacterium]